MRLPSDAETRLLLVLHRQGPTAGVDLASLADVAQGGVYTLMSRLGGHGLVERNGDLVRTGKRPREPYMLTAKGVRVAAALKTLRDELGADRTASMSATPTPTEQAVAISDVVDRIRDKRGEG